MKFEKTLQKSIYKPWGDRYLNYGKLKELLREDSDGDQAAWTEADESRFVEELLNVQLEKVNSFQANMYRQLGERMSDCENQLEGLEGPRVPESVPGSGLEGSERRRQVLERVLNTLETITKEVNELERFSRLNFTGALKAAKKHDRRRGTNYRLRPILQVRLAALPFNSEDYSPLLYRLSAMYAFARQQLSDPSKRLSSTSDMKPDKRSYVSHKCQQWTTKFCACLFADSCIVFVHPDNLLELKTCILRHLPVLVYSPNTTKNADGAGEGPAITSLYFDSPRFDLYNKKIERGSGASSVRIRWFGQLADRPELLIEKKTVLDGDDSHEQRFVIKDKYVIPFIRGEYKMQKSTKKLRERQGPDSREARELEFDADDLQRFIEANALQPVVRANYTRSAFQVPGDDRVRISIDTNIALIREDALDLERPCRDPESWHRNEIDASRMHYPFESIKKGEISRFPYCLLEIKTRSGLPRARVTWVEELMASHLVKETPRFSKFVHGVATLFEDQVNIFPFWMSLLETDIRKDPDEAFREEQERKAKQAEDEFAVGSFLGSSHKPSYRISTSSPVAHTFGVSGRRTSAGGSKSINALPKDANGIGERDPDAMDDPLPEEQDGGSSGLRDVLPTLSTSKYARLKRSQTALPIVVKEPSFWIKDVGPVKVEAKVWLANQR